MPPSNPVLDIYQQGTQRGWPVVTRVGIGLWMVTNVGAFVNLAANTDPFKERHAAVFAAMVLALVGHLGMRATRSPAT